MKIFIKYKEDGVILNASTSPFSDLEGFLLLETEVEEDFWDNFSDFKVVEGQLVPFIDLESYRKQKDLELNNACNVAISNGFKHIINGEEYHFSFDTEAQLNYQGSERLLSADMVQAIDFTVFKNGDYARIAIDKIEMQNLTMAILKHKVTNIAKYRDILLPLVQEATTKEEIENIQW